jgi:hypothetical protein
MSKLSLNALKERAEAIASQDLLNSISGGTENACHDGKTSTWRDLAVGIGRLLYERNFGR